MKNLTTIERSARIPTPGCPWLALTFLYLAGLRLEAATLVLPPDCAGVDGNSMYANTAPPATGGRCQELYTASCFAGVKAGVVVRMACRPDRTVTAPRTVVLRGYELRLSTTQRAPGGLSSRFDDNLGPDATLVFSGDITWNTDGSGAAAGPRGFDYVVNFQHPFVYDPTKGNLLLEWRVADSPQGQPAFDAQLHSDARIRLLWGNSSTAAVANFSNEGVAVRQLTVEPLKLAIRLETNAVDLVVTGPPGWNGLVQRSSDLETWADWFGLTFETTPCQTNDLSAVAPQGQFYRLLMP